MDLNLFHESMIGRALEILERLEFSPQAVRADLSSEQRVFPGYLYSASELLDRAADLVSESAVLVHDNERRWRVFRGRVEEISNEVADQPVEEAARATDE